MSLRFDDNLRANFAKIANIGPRSREPTIDPAAVTVHGIHGLVRDLRPPRRAPYLHGHLY